MSDAIPPRIQTAIKDFLGADKTGSITLHIKEGRIQGCKVEETIRLDKTVRDFVNETMKG